MKGHKLRLVYGDHSKEMALIAEYHKRAAENVANENQRAMQLAYAKSFEEGSLEAFKNSQRFWIRYVKVSLLIRGILEEPCFRDIVSELAQKSKLQNHVSGARLLNYY